MNITTHEQGTATVLALQGKIMKETDVTEFVDTVKACVFENHIRLVLDFSDVDYINSSGLGMLITAQDLVLGVSGKLRLACLNDSVNKMMAVNRLNLVFEIFPTVDAAIASLN